MDDILDIVDKTKPVDNTDKIDFKGEEKPEPTYNNNNSGNGGGNPKKENLYENPDIEGKAIKPEEMLRFNRMVTFIGLDPIDDGLKTVLNEIGSDLFSKGFTLRNPVESNDSVIGNVRPVFKDRELLFLPWKKFNADIQDGATIACPKPTDCAYYHAAYYHKAFKKLPNAVRSIISRTVNTVLGEDCKTPINLLICYSRDGADNSKEVDFKTTGNISFIINLCDELNIPIFNLGKPGTKERLQEFTKTFA